MRLYIGFLSLLSAIATYTLFVVAVPSPDGWSTIMQRLSVGFGVLCVIPTLVLLIKRRRPHGFVFSQSALFWFLIHPHMSILFWGIGCIVGAVMLAEATEESESWYSMSFLRRMVAGILAFGAATGGLRYWYYPFEDVSVAGVILIQLLLFGLAVALVPITRRDRQRLERWGIIKRTSNRTT